jgi:hypothetical protein
MTSSLKSRFEFARRRLLFVSAHKAAIYHWRGGDLGTSYLFDSNEEGRRLFTRYLRETPNLPVHMLVDLFEEEFRKDTVPHVFGPDRTAILARKKARLFRETPYFHYMMQGREEDGRHDDRVLMSAITNPGLVKPWVALLDENKVPLAGMSSVPLFTRSLIKLLPDAKDNVLVVSLQSISGLRQSFFQKGELRISRLVQLPRYGTQPYGPQIREEVEKIRRYLNSLRLASPDDPVDVYVLVAGDLMEDLQTAYRGSGYGGFRVLDINDLLEASGSKRRVGTPFSDQLFAHRLLSQPPSNAYASPTERRYFTMRRMRQGMLAASVILLASSGIWGGLNLLKALSLSQQTVAAQKKTEFYQARYQMARERLPQTAVEPRDIQVAVELVDTLESQRATPLEMLQVLSQGLDKLPEVQLDSIHWAARANPDAELARDAGRRSTSSTSQLATQVDQKKYRYYQIAVVNGRLNPFDGNFRRAIATINDFAEALRGIESVYDVQIQSLPLDVSSDASLQGSTSAQRGDAVFALRVVVGIADEA